MIFCHLKLSHPPTLAAAGEAEKKRQTFHGAKSSSREFLDQESSVRCTTKSVELAEFALHTKLQLVSC